MNEEEIFQSTNVTHEQLARAQIYMLGKINLLIEKIEERVRHHDKLEKMHEIMSKNNEARLRVMDHTITQIQTVGLVAVFLIPILVTAIGFKVYLPSVVGREVQSEARSHAK